MATENEFTPETVMAAVTELTKTMVETKKQFAGLDGLSKDKVEKINKFLDEQETKSQELTRVLALREQETKDALERLTSLETAISKPNAPEAKKLELEAEIKAYHGFITNGEESMSPDERKYLRSDKDTDGGYLDPSETLNEILKNITEISPIRAIARVRKAGRKSLVIPIRNTLVTGGWGDEGDSASDSHSTYSKDEMPLHKIHVNVPITIEELADATFNMESEINADVVEDFNQRENAAFVNGTGVARPEGFMVNASVSSRNSGVADNITMDSVILLTGDLKTGYSPTYLLNRTTLAVLRTLKAGNGMYLWQAGNLAAGVPNAIAGYSYMETPDMDDIAANAYPIAFGDFREGYMIGDRMAINVIRDPYTLKKSGKVEFTFIRRVGGQVVKPEAIKKLKCAA